jgi:hypothetical protein
MRDPLPSWAHQSEKEGGSSVIFSLWMPGAEEWKGHWAGFAGRLLAAAEERLESCATVRHTCGTRIMACDPSWPSGHMIQDARWRLHHGGSTEARPGDEQQWRGQPRSARGQGRWLGARRVHGGPRAPATTSSAPSAMAAARRGDAPVMFDPCKRVREVENDEVKAVVHSVVATVAWSIGSGSGGRSSAQSAMAAAAAFARGGSKRSQGRGGGGEWRSRDARASSTEGVGVQGTCPGSWGRGSSMLGTSMTRVGHCDIFMNNWRVLRCLIWRLILDQLRANSGHGPKGKVKAHTMLYKIYLRLMTTGALD